MSSLRLLEIAVQVAEDSVASLRVSLAEAKGSMSEGRLKARYDKAVAELRRAQQACEAVYRAEAGFREDENFDYDEDR